MEGNRQQSALHPLQEWVRMYAATAEESNFFLDGTRMQKQRQPLRVAINALRKPATIEQKLSDCGVHA